MTALLKVCGGALILLVFLLAARGERHTAVIGGAAGLVIFAFILARAAPIIEFITNLGADIPSGSNLVPIIGILLRALGITLLADAVANVCRDAGEGSLAEKVEFAGRIEVILLSLPLITNILNLVKQTII